MTNNNEAKPASKAAKQLISLWNASLNSIFMTVDVEDGPNPPEIVVNVRSNEADKLRVGKKDLSFLARIMETSTIQHIPLVKNADGQPKPTEEGQKLLDESGQSSDVTLALLMTLAMAFIEEPESSDDVSEDDLMAMLLVMAEATGHSTADIPTESLQIREKVVGKEDGKDVRHITINVLSEKSDADSNLRNLQTEFVALYKAGKITVALKPYTQEEVDSFGKSMRDTE